MSYDLMELVWDRFPQGGSDKLVMLYLAKRAQDNGTQIYPSIATIARAISLTPRGTQKVLRRLETDQWISNERSSGGLFKSTNCYRINLEKLSTPLNPSSPLNASSPLNSSSPYPCPPVHPTPEPQFTPPLNWSSPNKQGINKGYKSRETRARAKPPPTENPAPPIPKEPALKEILNPHLDMPQEWAAWASGQRPTWTERDIEDVWIKFRAHWSGKGGRADWFATWQDWVVREKRGGHERTGKAFMEELAQRELQRQIRPR